jgi:hypothetical protein
VSPLSLNPQTTRHYLAAIWIVMILLLKPRLHYFKTHLTQIILMVMEME